MDLDHPHHPYEPIEHEVTIQTHAIRRYCHPIAIAAPGEEVDEVARRLGVSYSSLRKARLAGVFDERYYKGLGGKRGKPVPVIYSRELLDPSYRRFFARPHAIWGGAWEWLARMIPEGFEQTVVRRPVFRRMDGIKVPGGENSELRIQNSEESPPHPALSPEYGGEGGTSNIQHSTSNVQREREFSDETQFMGWSWVCPGCKKEAGTIYYPVPVRTLFDCWFTDPVIQLKLNDADLMQPPPATFACRKCHEIRYFSSIEADSWNMVIRYFTGGMLYGCEVERPAGFVGERKKTRVRQLNRAAPMQRKVLTRLSNGWSSFQIARDLGVTMDAVKSQVQRICRQEEVADRHALAEKLNFAVSPLLNRDERAGVRRAAVKEMILAGMSNRQIMERLNVEYRIVNADVCAIYEIHGVSGLGLKARRALAGKFGVALAETEGEKLRKKIGEMLEGGMRRSQIARELKMSWNGLKWHWEQLRRESGEGEETGRIAVVHAQSHRHPDREVREAHHT
jgi:DNA-binding CsgD family transcriptional regulator